ncbi:hypothetical protein KKC63_02510, partial [Patescibacteria group bacterium]|nr:hypothetical protein [Patescibacteria group bacterium]
MPRIDFLSSLLALRDLLVLGTGTELFRSSVSRLHASSGEFDLNATIIPPPGMACVDSTPERLLSTSKASILIRSIPETLGKVTYTNCL